MALYASSAVPLASLALPVYFPSSSTSNVNKSVKPISEAQAAN